MLPDNSPTVVNTGRTIALVLSLFICTYRVYAEDSNEYYSELPLSNIGSAHPSPAQATGPRLSDLLHLKDSVSEILSQAPRTNIKETYNGEPSELPGLTKRIFCNGFTGCGGRFRDRRRLLKPAVDLGKRLPVFSKRPFCNAYGCYNSGRKRSSQWSSDNKIETPQTSEQKEIASIEMWPWLRMKKLFCNGYGGCQNMGKRMVIPAADVAKEVVDGHQLSEPLLKADWAEGKKRFFTSSFDEDFDSLIDEMRR